MCAKDGLFRNTMKKYTCLQPVLLGLNLEHLTENLDPIESCLNFFPARPSDL